MKARFRVEALLDMASKKTVATVTIDRTSGMFSVRPLRRKRAYELALADVASMVVRGMIAAELREKRAAKKKARAR